LDQGCLEDLEGRTADVNGGHAHLDARFLGRHQHGGGYADHGEGCTSGRSNDVHLVLLCPKTVIC
jgi:hypothetical protein